MSDIEKRVFSLAKILNKDIEPAAESAGVLKAWCAGLCMIEKDFDYIFSQMSPEQTSGTALGLMCNLFNIESDLPEDEKRTLIKKGFRRVYGEYESGEFKSALEKYNMKAAVIISRMTVKSITGSIKDNSGISALGKILKNYLPPGVTAVFNGWGLNFDYWDSTEYLFEDYDNLDFTFNMLETLT